MTEHGVTTLPDTVRQRLVALGSDALGAMGADEVPLRLRPVARFAPSRRARLGASEIAAAIDAEPAFRRRVLEAASASQAGLVDAVGRGAPPAAADPGDVAVVAYLVRPEGWQGIVETAAESVRRGEEAGRSERDSVAVARMREQLDAARAAARESRDRMKAEVDRLKSENSTLRRKLQEARATLQAARQAEAVASVAAAELADRAQQSARADDSELRRSRQRLAEAEAALEVARRAGRDARGLDNARLRLLIDTLVEAAGGLRRELALPASDLSPADTVDAASPGGTRASVRARGTDDPRRLEELLDLPRVHVIVDGYNVTKSAWPTMPLEAQRNRLVQGLAPVAARTGAEITCTFDGADVTVPPPVGKAKGVRVRFSRHGHTADDLIRHLVEAEPEGRPIVVVTSDREIAETVRRPGVHSVDSAALTGLLGR
jgi:predicted RNA-binding protein with PIN domain